MGAPVLTRRRPAAPAAGRPPASRSTARLRRRLRPWLLLAPALLVIGILLLFPLGRVVWLSFQDYGLRNVVSGESNYNGVDNYVRLLGDPYLWTVVLPNTVGFAVVAVGGTVAFGTLVALLLRSLRPLWRTVVIGCIMLAWAMPAVTGTYVWIWIFDVDRGLVAELLRALGLLGPEGFNWFTERLMFYGIVTLNIVHHGFPFVAVTVLAGLLTIPRELHEAALLDGANAWQRFWRVTVPTIRPVFAVVTILSTIWDFKVFAQVYLMPGGSGSNPDVLNFGVWSYVRSFGQQNYGLGSTIAVLLTLMLLAVTVVYLRALFRDEELR
ncbi:N,N'-diacetylchitobiose transport system permease protein [Spinactinospora alkalitolerans]|uniref:N,N'-diacetylchitobiose transport system permease protein n=1 Tax=Spinactinospora alkalitolerans TaxID=687207 RepID=A0A852TS33_9ACTN|nr:N,N'-diacetylchitobiose transport system permease protein [Spinactinospora alkalitolerans]